MDRFRCPAGVSAHTARKREDLGANIKEVLGERGQGAGKEVLVRWLGNDSARPSWALLSDIRKNVSFAKAYAEYQAAGDVAALQPALHESDSALAWGMDEVVIGYSSFKRRGHGGIGSEH